MATDPCQPRAPVRADHDQIRLLRPRGADDLLVRDASVDQQRPPAHADLAWLGEQGIQLLFGGPSPEVAMSW